MSTFVDLFARILPADLLARGRALAKELAPYVAIELLLPGGSLIALLLWLYSRRKANTRATRRNDRIMCTE